MLRFVRLSLVAAATTALVACGGGAKIGGGKEGAAQAAFQAGQPASNGAKSGQNLLRQLASAAATGTAEVSAPCAKSGSVKLTLDLTSTGSQDGSFKYKADYDKCNQDGVNSYDGSMEMEFKINVTATSADVSIRLKGKVDISGDISDSIDADVTETFASSFTSATSGSVSIKVDGSIKTSNNSYTYTNESITFSVDGKLPVDNGNS